MISTLDPDDKDWWDKEMSRYEARQARRQYRPAVLIGLTIIAIMVVLYKCQDSRWHPQFPPPVEQQLEDTIPMRVDRRTRSHHSIRRRIRRPHKDPLDFGSYSFYSCNGHGVIWSLDSNLKKGGYCAKWRGRIIANKDSCGSWVVNDLTAVDSIKQSFIEIKEWRAKQMEDSL